MSPLAEILAQANKSPPAPPQPTVQPTNVAGIYANNDAQNLAVYNAQMAQQNAMYGGLASLGSAAIGAGGKMLGGAGAAGAAGGGADATMLALTQALGPAAIL